MDKHAPQNGSAPLLAEYTSTSQRLSPTGSELLTLMVTYCPNKLGRQKNDTPLEGTMRLLPHRGLVIPSSLDAGPNEHR